MEMHEFFAKMEENLKKIQINITKKQCEQFYFYMNLLIEWNEKMNLTAITEPNEVITKHFIDSLTIQPYIKKGENILDIGTGAGFPGIPLAIMNENCSFTLVDSLNKRIIFLQEVLQKLELKNVKTIHARAEDLSKMPNQIENYHIVTSRAVAKLNVLLEYMIPFLKIDGKCISMKGSNVIDEIEEAKKAIEVLGGKLIEKSAFILPNSDIERNIIMIQKVKHTPKQYPRKAGIPTKEPINSYNSQL